MQHPQKRRQCWACNPIASSSLCTQTLNNDFNQFIFVTWGQWQGNFGAYPLDSNGKPNDDATFGARREGRLPFDCLCPFSPWTEGDGSSSTDPLLFFLYFPPGQSPVPQCCREDANCNMECADIGTNWEDGASYKRIGKIQDRSGRNHRSAMEGRRSRFPCRWQMKFCTRQRTTKELEEQEL